MNQIRKWALIYAGTLAAAFLVIVTRRPDAVRNAQFWAEDGAIWYADAYNRGVLYSLVTPEAGYFQTFSRLVAIAGQAVPLESAPLFFNLAAIGVQATVAAFIVSPRLARAVPSLAARMLLAFVYLALPHSSEVFANLTNSQWHLGLLAFLVIVAEPSRNRWWRAFDVAAIALCAFSGPLCILLVPIAAIKYWQRREKWILVLLAVLFAGAAVQTVSLLTHERPSQAELGVSPVRFFRIAGRHLFASPLIGGKGFNGVEKYTGLSSVVLAAANIGGFAGLVYCIANAGSELRLLILFSGLIFAASLVSPAVSPHGSQWEAIASDNTALRYWFIPNLCLFAGLVFLAARSPARITRYIAAAVLLFSMSGIVLDWRIPAFRDLKFREYAAEFERAAPGTEVSIPINPNWEMRLVRK